MKIKKSELKQIVEEELSKVMSESSAADAIRKERDEKVAELIASDPNVPAFEELSDIANELEGKSQEQVDRIVQALGHQDEFAFYAALNDLADKVKPTMKARRALHVAYNKKLDALPKPKSKPSTRYPRGKEAWDAVVYGGEHGLDYGRDY